jgi:hypothetical protein
MNLGPSLQRCIRPRTPLVSSATATLTPTTFLYWSAVPSSVCPTHQVLLLLPLLGRSHRYARIVWKGDSQSHGGSICLTVMV